MMIIKEWIVLQTTTVAKMTKIRVIGTIFLSILSFLAAKATHSEDFPPQVNIAEDSYQGVCHP